MQYSKQDADPSAIYVAVPAIDLSQNIFKKTDMSDSTKKAIFSFYTIYLILFCLVNSKTVGAGVYPTNNRARGRVNLEQVAIITI